uniref:Uncharacterized protein n=1 Tax=Arundo donax TaxID=35708 RepID=A0A0A9C0U4_ARUDO
MGCNLLYRAYQTSQHLALCGRVHQISKNFHVLSPFYSINRNPLS